MLMIFTHQTTIHFHDADPAGVLFFGRAFTLMHECYEKFIEHLGIPYDEWFASSEHVTPIANAEAQYKKPMLPSKTYDVKMKIIELRESVFKLETEFMDGEQLHCRIQTLHVFADRTTFKKTKIPQGYYSLFKQALEKI